MTIMPSKTEAQRKLFRMALAVRTGKLNRSKVSKEVLDIADSSMSDSKLKEFASSVNNESLTHFMQKQLNEMKKRRTYTCH